MLEGVHSSSRNSSNINKLLGSDTDDAWCVLIHLLPACDFALREFSMQSMLFITAAIAVVSFSSGFSALGLLYKS